MEYMEKNSNERCIRLFAAVVVITALAGGLSNGIFSNYFKDAFDVTALQRGFLETPRESGGVLCAFIFIGVGFMSDAVLGIVSEILMAIGIAVMAFFQPDYAVMTAFLVIHSAGQHLFMPVNDSIGMGLAEADKGGETLGRLKKCNDIAAMAAGILVFIGFKAGFFSFVTPVILPFAIAFVLFVIAAAILFSLRGELAKGRPKSQRIAVKKDYLPYYVTTFAYGCQKRIRLVFAPWILIELLRQGADTIAISMILFRLIGGLIAPHIGRFIDGHGIKNALRAEAGFIFAVFVFNGIVAWTIVDGGYDGAFWIALGVICYVLSYITEQFNMVHSVMLKKLAGDRKEDIAANLSMGVTVDHVMAIVVSPILGFVWIKLGPQWVFFFTACTAVIQILVARFMLRGCE